MMSLSAKASNTTNDWKEYYSRSNQCWCWESASRKVRYLPASRSQKAVFTAGWVILPAPTNQEQPTYYNVFTQKIVKDRSKIPEFSQSKDVGNKKRTYDNRNNDSTDQEKAAAHYNKLQRNRKDRAKGSLANMRTLNNWIKAVLIDLSLSRAISRRSKSDIVSNTVSVLELACGKGGDFFKIKNSCPSNLQLDYIGVDIAKQSLHEFTHRIQQNEQKRRRRVVRGAQSIRVRLACTNLGTDRLSIHENIKDKCTTQFLSCWDSSSSTWEKRAGVFTDDQKFDLVSMQFALHYMCQSSKRLQTFFQSWSDNLKESGYFVATTMDPERVKKYFKTDNGNSGIIIIRDQKNRPCCRMVMDSKTKALVWKKKRNNSNDVWLDYTFGIKYDMTLTEYNDDDDELSCNFVEAPEWVVPMASLVHHAWKYGNLFLVHKESHNFGEFFQAKQGENEKYKDLLTQMSVSADNSRGLSEIEWTMANLYKTLVFQKGGNGRRVAIIVPFRDEYPEQERSKHLAQFVPYMIRYMAKALVPFYILIIEQSQNDGRKFNRGKLLNVGYQIAKQRQCDAYIFHDVDLLPDDDLMEHYRCNSPELETAPNHIARVWSRYSTNNVDCIGGVTAFSASVFEKLNGFPNNFWGWGGEDDELRKRLRAIGKQVSAPSKGSFKDLENMTLGEKMALLRKKNIDSAGTDNLWKCMVKKEVLKEHASTWQSNGLFHTGVDGIRRETQLFFQKSKEDVHSSGFASKITVQLAPNNDKWDTITSWTNI